MLGLLGLPNFAEAFVAGFAGANVAHLLIKALELPALRVGRVFDRALFRDERDLIERVLVGRAVEDGNDFFSNGHVESAPSRFEQNPLAKGHAAIAER